MRVHFGYWWPFARTAWGWTVGIAEVSFALYYAPKKMLETWDWYLDRFRDHKVLAFLEEQIVRANYVKPEGRPQSATPKSVRDIAEGTHLSEKKVLGSLKRLKRKKAVTAMPNGEWRADIPPLGQN